MEELLREAFQLGQQWVHDMNNDKEPATFNEWYASNEVQGQVKNCSIPDVLLQSEQLCDNPHCEDGIVDKDMYGHPIYCQVCDSHN